MADNNTLTHVFVSAKADDPNSSLIRPSSWNKEHLFAGGSPLYYLMWDSTKSDKVSFDNIWARFPYIDLSKPPYSIDATGGNASSNTAAIQSAIDTRLAAGTPGTLALPPGLIETNNTLNIPGVYSASSFPEVEAPTLRLIGSGKRSTVIVPHFTQVLQTTRKAAFILGGGIALQDFTIMNPRIYSSIVPAYASYNTLYYGLVFRDVSWGISVINIDIRYFHVPVSIGCIKKINTSTYELEPTSGGSAFPSTDIAQGSFYNCRISAYTREFEDSTLNAATQNNANGTNLSQGVGHTTDLTSAVFSDGSYGLEVGAQSTVSFDFTRCTIENLNARTNGTVRTHAPGDLVFDKSLLSAPPPNGDSSFIHFENSVASGSIVNYDKCYLIGGIYSGRTAYGVVGINQCSGENHIATEYPSGTVVLFRPLGSDDDLQVELRIRGLDIGRGSGTKIIRLSSLAQSSVVGCPYGTQAAYVNIRKYRLEDITGLGLVQFGHENVLYGHRLEQAQSILPSVAASLAGKAVDPLFLSQKVYLRPNGEGNTGFTIGLYKEGTWFLQANAGANNILAQIAPVDLGTAYNISFDLYVQMVPTHLVSELNNELSFVVRFYNSSKNFVAANPIMLGSATATFNYSLIVDQQVVRFTQYHIIPPTGAAYIGVVAQANQNVARTAIIAYGNIRIWPAPTEEVVDLVLIPEFEASSVPTTGTWNTNDFVKKSPNAAGTPVGWYCTTAPSTFTAGANL